MFETYAKTKDRETKTYMDTVKETDRQRQTDR